MGPWVRLHANNTLRMLRTIAGVRITIDGAVGPESSVVVMNHQSLIDLAVGFSVIPGPLPLIPARRRYAWGIPGVSVFVRHARLPLVSQRRKDRHADLAMIADAAERTRRGETSFFIFPEGHRTTDGEIQPFMATGLRIALSRIRRPIYCIVGDGMWHVRTLADTIVRVAGSHVQVRILGPFEPPAEADIPQFVELLRGRMIATLHQIRAGTSVSAAPSRPAPTDAV